MQYGDNPVPVSELRYDDEIQSYKLNVEDAGKKKINVDLEDGSIIIKGKNGEDRTSQYVIKTEGKEMSLVKRKLIVNVLDKEITYDGTEQSFSDYELGDDTTFAYDDRPVTEIVTKATEVCENTPIDLKLKIFNASGEEVTDFYDLKVNKGNLTIKKREIEITGRNFEETYDGDPHTFEEFDLSEKTPLADGHEITVAAASSFMVVGEYENDLTATIKDENDVDVSKNYSVTIFPGSVTINKRELKVVTNSDTFTYDGEAHSVEGFTIAESTSLATGQRLVADGYKEFISADTYENSVTAVIKDKNGVDVTTNYKLSVTYGEVKINKRKIACETEGGEWIYDGKEHFVEGVKYQDEDGDQGLLRGQNLKPTNYPKITDVGERQNEPELEISQGETVVTENYEIDYLGCGTLKVTQLAIELSTDSAKREYNGEPLTAKSYTFKTGSNTPVDGQSLSLEYVNSQTDVGTTKNAINPDTMKIIDSIGGEKTKNYSITVNFGDLTVTPRPVDFVTAEGEKIYDGLALTCKSIIVASHTPLVKGHKAVSSESEVDYFSELTDVGSIENKGRLRKVTIKDGNGRDVSANYAVRNLFFGILTVKPRPITITTATKSWTYDDDYHSSAEYKEIRYRGPIAEGQKAKPLADGHKAVAVQNNSTRVIDVGEYENKAEFTIKDSSDYDVTANYDIECICGKLTITPKTLNIVTYSAKKTYDGTPITFANATADWKKSHNGEQYYIKDTPVVKGHSVEVYGYNTPTDYAQNGYKNSDVKVKVYKNAEGVVSEKTKNYNIVVTPGDLVIDKLAFNYSTRGASETFDGEILTDKWFCKAFSVNEGDHGETEFIDYTIPSSGLKRRFKITFSSLLFPGSEESRITDWSVTDDKDNILKKDNYRFDLIGDAGILTIYKRDISITTNGGTREYDGTAFTVEEGCTYSNNKNDYNTGLITNPQTGKRKHNIEVKFKSFKNVADSGKNMPLEVSITRDGDGKDLTRGYNIIPDYGIVTITPIKIAYTTYGASKTFDGEILTGKWSCEKIFKNSDSYEHDDVQCYDYTIPSSSVKHRIRITFSSLLFPGSKESRITNWSVTDENGEFVYSNNYQFDLTGNAGLLNVSKRTIKISTDGISRIYDGTAFSVEGYTYTDNENDYDTGLIVNPQTGKRKHNIEVKFKSFRNVADSGKNMPLEVSITRDGDGLNLTKGYHVSYDYGDIEITKRKVTFVTDSDEWLYDGVSHFNRSYTVKEGNDGVVKTHVTRVNSIVPTVRIPSLNTVDNQLSIEIYDENGKIVSENYDIEYEYGKLKVNGYILKIHTGSDYKDYDGKPLTYDFWRLVEVVNCGMSEDIDIDEFPENIKIIVEVYGSITDVGTEPNSAQAVVIEKYIADGETRYKLAAGYYPEITAGELKILADDGTGGGTGGGEDKRGGTLDDSGKIEGGGNPSQGSTSSGGGSRIALEVKSGADGTAYFRYMSFGDYDGKGWSKASQYGQLIEGRYSYNYLASYALQNLGYSATNAEIKSYSNYMLPYFTVAGLGDYVVQSSDTVYDGTIPAEYTLGYIPFDYLTSKSDLAKFPTHLPDNLVDYESEYRLFVYKNYLSVPTKTRAYLESVIEKEGFVAAEDKYRDVLRVAKYVQSVAKYNGNYDPMMNYESDIVIAFMRDYKEGICQHYASAATLLFRTLGIPARYTIGYAGETKSNEWTEIDVQNAHAWVEIYVDGFGWVPIEVTGGGVGGGTGGSGGGSGEIDDGSGGGTGGSGSSGGNGGGSGEGESKKIIVKPVDVDKAYDGTPLYALNEIEENDAIKKLLEHGYDYEVVVSGSRTERGESESVIEEFRLLDKSGRDATADFEIIYKNGKIKITNTQIIVNLYKITKYYDRTPLSYDEDDYWVEGLPSGYKLELKLSGSITEVGTFDIEKLYELPVKVTDENGNDVTANYYVKFVGEGLTVMPNKITVVTNSAEKVYDGKALSSPIAWVGLGKLVDGHKIKVIENSEVSIEEKGEVENRLGVIIVDENGVDVTENYEITYRYGKLTVK